MIDLAIGLKGRVELEISTLADPVTGRLVNARERLRFLMEGIELWLVLMSLAPANIIAAILPARRRFCLGCGDRKGTRQAH